MRYIDLELNSKLIHCVPVYEDTGETSEYTDLMLGYLLKYMSKYGLVTHDYIENKQELFLTEIYRLTHLYNYDLNFCSNGYSADEYNKLIIEDKKTGRKYSIY